MPTSNGIQMIVYIFKHAVPLSNFLEELFWLTCLNLVIVFTDLSFLFNCFKAFLIGHSILGCLKIVLIAKINFQVVFKMLIKLFSCLKSVLFDMS